MKPLYIGLHEVQVGRVGGIENAAYGLCIGLIRNGVPVRLGVFDLSDLSSEFVSEVRQVAPGAFHAPPPMIRRLGRLAAREAFFVSAALAGARHLSINYRLPVAALLTPWARPLAIVHDVLPLVRKEDTRGVKRLFYRMELARTLLLASFVITISHFSRAALLERFPRLGRRARIEVVWNAIDWENLLAAPGPKSPFEGDLLISVSNDYPHKNLSVIVDAVKQLRRHQSEVCLLLVGKAASAFRSVSASTVLSEVERLPAFASVWDGELKAAGVARIDGLTRSELGLLLKSASVVLHPSMYEGFGLPVVEAVGMGASVLTTRCGSIPEVAGESAFYVDTPSSVDEWVGKISEQLLAAKSLDMPARADYRDRFSPQNVTRPLARMLAETP